jgi:hypothetical protein
MMSVNALHERPTIVTLKDVLLDAAARRGGAALL